MIPQRTNTFPIPLYNKHWPDDCLMKPQQVANTTYCGLYTDFDIQI